MDRYNDGLKKGGRARRSRWAAPQRRGAAGAVLGGDRTVIEGAFPDPRQVVAGYWILQVASVEEAVDWAERFPFEALSRVYPGEYGTDGELELRQVFQLEA
jgi:hypothetical protein